MKERYDPLIRDVGLLTKTPYAVLKALVEVSSGYNPFVHRVEEDDWAEMSKYSNIWTDCFTMHFVNTMTQFEPGETELKNLYCARYGLGMIHYGLARTKLGFKEHPCVLWEDPRKGLDLAARYLQEMVKYFPHIPEPLKWSLAVVAYFTVDPVKIMEVITEVTKTTVGDTSKYPAPFQKLLLKKMDVDKATRLIEIMDHFRECQAKHKKEELSLMVS